MTFLPSIRFGFKSLCRKPGHNRPPAAIDKAGILCSASYKLISGRKVLSKNWTRLLKEVVFRINSNAILLRKDLFIKVLGIRYFRCHAAGALFVYILVKVDGRPFKATGGGKMLQHFGLKSGRVLGGPVLAVLLAGFGLLGFAQNANAVLFHLTNWNDPVLDASTDEVTVDVTTAGGITTLVVNWVSGDSGLTAIGIDQFFYDSTVTVASAPASWTAPPPSEGFDYTGTFTADGFGSFETRGASPGGTLLSTTFVLSGDASAALNSAEDFAAHVRYGNDCSGFVSGDGRGGTNTSTSNCGAQIPEPTSLMLLGSGLVGIGLWQWRRRKEIKA